MHVFGLAFQSFDRVPRRLGPSLSVVVRFCLCLLSCCRRLGDSFQGNSFQSSSSWSVLAPGGMSLPCPAEPPGAKLQRGNVKTCDLQVRVRVRGFERPLVPSGLVERERERA